MVDSNINYVIAKRSEMEEIISKLKQKANFDGEISFPTGVLDLVNNIEVGQPGYAGGDIETTVTGSIMCGICGSVYGDIQGGVIGTVYGCGHECGFAITNGIQGNVCGNICGDICGNIYGNFYGSIQGCGDIRLNNYYGDSNVSFSLWDGEITRFCGRILNPNNLTILGCGNISGFDEYFNDKFSFYQDNGEITRFCGRILNPNDLTILGCGNIQTFDAYYTSYEAICKFSLYDGMIENFSGFIYSPSNLRVSGCGRIIGESSNLYGDLYFGFQSELNDGGLYNFCGTIDGGNITFLKSGMIRLVDSYDSNFSDIEVTAGHLSFACGNVKYGRLYLTNYGTCGNITSYIDEGDENSAYTVELESGFVNNISGTLNKYNDCLQYNSGVKTEMIINGQTYCGYAFIAS